MPDDRPRALPSPTAASLDSAIFFLHIGRAREQLNGGLLEDARRELELARLARPEDDDLLNLVSLVEFRRGDFAEAARATRTLLEKNPDSALLRASLGVIHFKAGLFTEAETELHRAIELDPAHARAHLYLGLLEKTRGDLPRALEHLRRAGARRAAREVEDRLRAAAAGDAPKEIPGRDAEDRPLFRVRPDGTLEVASPGLVYVRRGSVVSFGGRLRFGEEPAYAGTRLEALLRAEGRGDLLLREEGRRPVLREITGAPLYLEGSRLLALSAGLRSRLEPIRDFRSHRRVDVVRAQGRGAAVFAVAGEIQAHDVSEEFPLHLSARDLVAWSGDLLASVVEDRFLDEIMVRDPSSSAKLRFEGSGVVLTEARGNP